MVKGYKTETNAHTSFTLPLVNFGNWRTENAYMQLFPSAADSLTPPGGDTGRDVPLRLH